MVSDGETLTVQRLRAGEDRLRDRRHSRSNSRKDQTHGKSSRIRSFGSRLREIGGVSRSLVLTASRYFGDRETLCLYWPLGTLLFTGPKVLDFYAGFCAHRATCFKADGQDIADLKLVLDGNSSAENQAGRIRG
jgi:hypothetical protein